MREEMKRMMIAFGAAMLIAAGCQTTTVPPGGPAKTVALEPAAIRLVSNIAGNVNFEENYKEFKDKYKRRPYIVVNTNWNYSGTKGEKCDLIPRFLSARNSINALLFETGLFRIYDDEAADEILSRIIWSADGGLEKINLDEWTENTPPPDYMMRGEFREFEVVDGCQLYKLALTIHNVRTREIVWTGFQTDIKL